MRRLPRLTALFLAAALAGCTAQSGTGPVVFENLGDLKTKLVAYHDSGRWAADQARVGAEAEAWLVARAAMKRPGERLAIVFDIDETSLSNYPALRADDFGFIMGGPCRLVDGPCGMEAWINSGRDAPIPSSLALYRRARDLGVHVFFITGRHESMRPATERNLRKAGYDSWDRLILEPRGSKFRSAADYKAPHRAAIEAAGYRIVVNIGDQPSDLAGGHAERTFLMPNPYYRIP